MMILVDKFLLLFFVLIVQSTAVFFLYLGLF